MKLKNRRMILRYNNLLYIVKLYFLKLYSPNLKQIHINEYLKVIKNMIHKNLV